MKKTFCVAKENSVKITEKNPPILKNVLANNTSANCLICKSYKEVTWIYCKKTNNLNKKLAQDSTRHFCKEDLLSMQKHMKKGSVCPAVRKMLIKTATRYCFTQFRVAIPNKATNKFWIGCREKGTLMQLMGFYMHINTIEDRVKFTR